MTDERQVYLVWDERMMLHKPILLDLSEMENVQGPHFVPERPSRAWAVSRALEGLECRLRLRDAELEGPDAPGRFLHLPCPVADAESICRTHTRAHYERIRRTSELSDEALVGMTVENELYFCKDTFLAASLAAGGCIEAVNAVTSGAGPNRALAIVRPPGHHATKNRAMGFCYFNNTAVAAKHAIATGRASRVLILDWDIHHGNGIQDVTYKDPDIFYLSLHRTSEEGEDGYYYPGTGRPEETGAGEGVGTNLNIAFDAKGMGNTEYAAAFQELVLPAVRSFGPDLVIVACGLDAARGDLLGDFGLSPEMFYIMQKSLIECVGDEIPIVSALEGGYNLSVIAECMKAVALALFDEPWEDDRGSGDDDGAAETKTLSTYWQRQMAAEKAAEQETTRKAIASIKKSARALARSQIAARSMLQALQVGYAPALHARRRPRLTDCDRYPVKRRMIRLWPDNPHICV